MKVIREDGLYALVLGTARIEWFPDSDSIFQFINSTFPMGTKVEWEITPEIYTYELY